MGCPTGSPITLLIIRALNSAVECHLHTVEVAGSNPAAPTKSTTYRRFHQMRVQCGSNRFYVTLVIGKLLYYPAVGRTDCFWDRLSIRVHSHLKRSVSKGILHRLHIFT